MATPQTFIFIGRSGSGKGTQADLLIKRFATRSEPIFYAETGEQIRKFFAVDNYSSRLAKEVSASGNRQPDFMADYMWSNLLLNKFEGTEYLIFDGTPRSLLQAQILDTAFIFYQRELIHVIALHISHACATGRLGKRGRNDDDEVGIKKRLEWYEKDVVPALDYYRTNSRYHLIEIDGERSIEDVHVDILAQCDQT